MAVDRVNTQCLRQLSEKCHKADRYMPPHLVVLHDRSVEVTHQVVHHAQEAEGGCVTGIELQDSLVRSLGFRVSSAMQGHELLCLRAARVPYFSLR